MFYYLHLLWLFVKMAIQQEAAFRVNFLINMLNTLLSFATGILGIYILFSRVNTIRGWTFSQTLALLGVYLLISALRDLVIQPNMDALGGIGGEIWTGRFDGTLIKPINKQFFVSFRYWRIWSLFDILIGGGVLTIAIHQLTQQLTFAAVAGFVLMLIASLIILYSALLVLASISLWFHGVPTIWIFNSLLQTGRYPVGVYPGWMQLILTWIIPVGFITTIPVQVLVGQALIGTVIGGFVFALCLFIAASLLFQRSLHRYSSASS